MPFIGDSRRRQLRRLSTKRVAQASTPSKDSAKPGGNSSESTPVVKQRRMSRASKHDGTKAIPPCITDHRQDSGSSRTSSKDHVNVFAFMESGGPSSGTDTEQVVNDVPALSSSGSSTSSRSPQLQSPCSDLEVHATESKGGFVWYDNHRRENSINSDSGVSMLSTSPVEESPVLGYKSKSYRYNDITPTTSHTRVMSGFAPDSVPETPAAHMSHIPSLDMHFMKEPEAYYGSSPYAHPPTPRTATARYPQPGLQAPWQSSPRQPSLGSLPSPTQTQVQVEKSGYDLLASAIDSRDQKFLTPIYRKFETLNNRILLYLQDEIAEMEDTLKKLDVAITQEEGRGTKPRTEAIYPSQLKWHRQELMCRIFTKVEQYNSALSSYSNLTKTLVPASKSDVSSYKNWISEYAPLVKQETDFLRNEADLMTVSQPRVKESAFPDATPIMVVVVGLVSTIVVFKVVPQLLARLVISLIMGVASLCTLAPNVLSDMANIRDSKQAIVVYAAVMLLLATIVG